MAKDIDIGDRVRLRGKFTTTATGAAVDPTTATVKVRKPDGTITTATPTKDAVGDYHHDVDPDAAGHWYFRFEGDAPAIAAEEGVFTVRASQF